MIQSGHGEGRRWIGAEWGRVWGCWVSPLQPTRGSGGASWAPPAGSGAEPQPKTDFGVFWRPQNAHFCTCMTKSAGDNLHYRLPTPKSGGTCPPVPPVIYAHESGSWSYGAWLCFGQLSSSKPVYISNNSWIRNSELKSPEKPIRTSLSECLCSKKIWKLIQTYSFR